MLVGEDGIARLSSARVAVIGVGGVGGYAAEMIVRAGVGHILILDSDEVSVSNRNRQLLALNSTVGRPKCQVLKERLLDINPDLDIVTVEKFIIAEGAVPDSGFEDASGTPSQLLGAYEFDYVVDAIDTVTAKIQIILQAQEAGVPVISAMGCGNRTDPTRLTVTDLFRTSQDPLARVMRRELKRRGVQRLKVVYSTEPAIRPLEPDSSCQKPCSNFPEREQAPAGRRSLPGSTSFVPPAAGMMLAAAVINDLTHFNPETRTRGGQQNQ